CSREGTGFFDYW
nr:immunoglobulin heavy chain junction region [Mus musculus]NSM03948.1 immunoglobulin heavy chain junction region [Mus musculus]NSM04386.1 immunoglobulin heavy chain junction region [Mus musculus]NSM04513.1 immunoglobulin heavy chain junction region [Mus musculus]NSM04621.1 immunoglobulin heavy chain junction region [Mus musculus]